MLPGIGLGRGRPNPSRVQLLSRCEKSRARAMLAFRQWKRDWAAAGEPYVEPAFAALFKELPSIEAAQKSDAGEMQRLVEAMLEDQAKKCPGEACFWKPRDIIALMRRRTLFPHALTCRLQGVRSAVGKLLCLYTNVVFEVNGERYKLCQRGSHRGRRYFLQLDPARPFVVPAGPSSQEKVARVDSNCSEKPEGKDTGQGQQNAA